MSEGVLSLTAHLNEIDNTFIAACFGDIFHSDPTINQMEQMDFFHGNRKTDQPFNKFIESFRNLFYCLEFMRILQQI